MVCQSEWENWQRGAPIDGETMGGGRKGGRRRRTRARGRRVYKHTLPRPLLPQRQSKNKQCPFFFPPSCPARAEEQDTPLKKFEKEVVVGGGEGTGIDTVIPPVEARGLSAGLAGGKKWPFSCCCCCCCCLV